MKPTALFAWAVFCACAVFVAGCGSKSKDATSQLQNAAAVMAQPDPAQPAPAPQPAQAAAPTADAPPPTPPTAAAVQSQEMNQAMASYKTGELEDAVTRLQKLRASSDMSAAKRMALNDAMAAVMTDIYEKAAKGDSRAVLAVQKYEELQSQARGH